MSEHGSRKGERRRGFEQTDVSARAMLKWAVGLFSFLALCMLVTFGYYVALQGPVGRRPVAAVREERLPPWPRLQANPARDLAAYQREQSALVGTYGWVDRRRGIVRLPVDRAIELVLHRGLPDWRARMEMKGDGR